MANQGKTVSCSTLVFPVRLMRRGIKETLNFLLRYEGLKRLGKRFVAGHPLLRAWLMELAGIASPYSARTMLRMTQLTNILERMPESAREIYDTLRQLYRIRGI